jgi:hypothetical protein
LSLLEPADFREFPKKIGGPVFSSGQFRMTRLKPAPPDDAERKRGAELVRKAVSQPI